MGVTRRLSLFAQAVAIALRRALARNPAPTLARRLRQALAGGAVSTLLLGWVWAGLLGAPAWGRTLDARAVRSAVLGNGLVLVVCEDEAAPVVAVELIVKAGSADESGEESGIAHLLEHVCWGRTERGDPRLEIEEVGGVTNAGTLRDFTRFYAAVQPGDFGVAMRALGKMVVRQRFDEADISRERSVILAEMASRTERPRAVLNDLAFAAVFGAEHPYGRPIEGDERSLNAVDGTRLLIFHRSWYVPNNMAVVVAGKVGLETARREAEAVLGGLQPGPAPVRRARPGGRSESGERVVEAPVSEAYVMAALVGPGVSELRAMCAADVLATVLTQRHVGRLVRELKDRRGLVKAVGVDFLTQRDRGLFGVWAICDEDRIDAVREAMGVELLRLSTEPVSPAELATAKRLLAAEYAFANETAGDRARTLGFYEAIRSYRIALEYVQRVEAVTASDIRAALVRYAGRPMWVVMRPAGEDR